MEAEMKVLVTGAKGLLGSEVVEELKRRQHKYIAVDIDEMDITDNGAVRKVVGQTRPGCIIHCAAYTAADAAEDNPDICNKINVGGTENIINACREYDIKLVFVSTDYVFDGSGTHFHLPSEECNPINVYGMSKYRSETMIKSMLEKYFIVRTSWLFGPNGRNFVKAILKKAETADKLTVVCDQIGSPTYAPDLARLLVDMAEMDKFGIYHATNEGICSWYEFACEILKLAGKTNVTVIPVTSEEYAAKAARPKNSRLSKDKLDEHGFERLPHWRDSLKKYIKALTERNT